MSYIDSSIASSYQYNIDGIRIARVENGQAVNYLVDQNRDYAQVITESTATNVIDYVYGDDLLSQSRQGQTFTYHYDGLGSTRLLTDELGNNTDSYDYEAFGETLNKTGTIENSYLYAGEQFDSGLDNYYLRARYYDQGVGRFTQMDEWRGNITRPVTLNKYLYANADPVNTIDPSGHFGLINLGASNKIAGHLNASVMSIFARKGLNQARKAKIFKIYNYVEWPLHFYMYAERKGSKSGIHYDVGAEGGWGNLGRQICRGNICGRMPGLIISRAAQRSSLKGKGKKIVSLSFFQYTVWHATVLGSEQMECSIDITYSLVPGPNCLSWTVKATAKAIALSKFRM